MCVPTGAIHADSGDTIVVTATRQTLRANELMSDVTVVTREEIERSSASSLGELLARQPGVELQTTGGPATRTQLHIRGTDSAHVILLIDGQRVGSATTGDPSWSRIPLQAVERIEILRGPASSLYGSDAIGGVVQIFTRRETTGFRKSAALAVATHGTRKVDASMSGGSETVRFSLTAGSARADGFSARSGTSFNPDVDGYDLGHVSGSLSIRHAPNHSIEVNVLASGGTSDYDGTGATRDFELEQKVTALSIASRDRFTDGWDSELRVGSTRDDLRDKTDSVEKSKIVTDQAQGNWQNTVTLPIGKAILGLDVLRQEVDSTTRFRVTERTIRAAYAGWIGSLDRHRAQFNVRRDETSDYDGKTTGLLGYGFQFSDSLRGHATAGTAFRVPTFNQLYRANYGNPVLQPETARNVEFGATWEAAEHRISVVRFDNRIDNLITNGPTSVSQTKAARIDGWTLAYSATFDRWNLETGADFQRPRDQATDAPLARRADKQGRVRIGTVVGDWNAQFEVVGAGRRFDGNGSRLHGYGLVNLSADYRLTNSWKLFARGSNVFDRAYTLAAGYNTGGAEWLLGLRYDD